ncbi:MAG: acetylornithine deacetylase [Gammaproteobacteria bacterium]|nr:acetylornithine deacetylase [Gammaproteobacteria bacterium]
MKSAPQLLEMIGQLIAIPSVSSTQAQFDTSNKPIIDCLANWLDDLGFQTEIIPSSTEKYNLIAWIGDGEDGLVLSGHTDTVNFDQTGWNTNPFLAEQVGSRLYGLGTADMKSFLAIAIEAAKDFVGKNLQQRLTIVATADEESTMQGVRTLVENNRKPGRFCIIGEPTNLTPVRQHKGVFMESITLYGKAGHASNPALGNNALEGMRVVLNELDRFKQELAEKYVDHDFIVPVPTLNLGHIHGGDNPNRICAECELHIDIRLLPGMQISALRDELHQRISNKIDSLGLTCKFKALFDGVPAFKTAEDSRIVKLVSGYTNKSPTSVTFATEAPFFNSMGMETVVLGPGSIDQAHQPNEFIELSSLKPTTELLQKVIHSICM